MTILDRPAQFQWDADSAPWKSENCRCTVEAQIAGYYKDTHISPADMRRAMQGGSNESGGTNPSEGVRGLEHYGIPAQQGWKTPDGLKALLDHGFPVDIAVNYGRVPANTKYRSDLGFNGLHSVLAVSTGTEDGLTGIYVRDPDHGSPAMPARPDKTFWPDFVWIPAFTALDPGRRNGIAVWPKSLKNTQPAAIDPVKYEHLIECIAEVNARSAPNTSADIKSLRANGARFNSSKLRKFGGSYTVSGVTRTDWLGYEVGNQTYWIARAYTKVVN